MAKADALIMARWDGSPRAPRDTESSGNGQHYSPECHGPYKQGADKAAMKKSAAVACAMQRPV